MQATRQDSKRRDRAARRRHHRRLAFAIAALSAIAGAFAPAAPTGLTMVDSLYAAAFAGIVTLATSSAKRWAWFVLAGGAAAAGSGDTVPLVLGTVALAGSFAALFRDRRHRVLGALVGAVAAQALLRLPTDLPFAVPTLVAAGGATVVCVSASRSFTNPRRLRWPSAIVVAALLGTGAAFAAGMLLAERDAADGIRAAQGALAAAAAGNDAESARLFTVAEDELAATADVARAWWLAPARVVPVLAPHVHALEELSAEGQALAATSAAQIETLDVSGLSVPGGIDLDAVERLSPRARLVVEALERTAAALDDARSPWLVPPARDRIDRFEAEVAASLGPARNAADGLDVAPTLLGGERRMTYLVLIGNPAEARELGGFVASVGTLTADEGQLEFEAEGSIGELGRQVEASGIVTDDLPVPLSASRPTRNVQNWTNTADFRVAADLATRLAPAFTGSDVDGVLYLDPHALAALLEITGPVRVEGLDAPLDADTAPFFLLRGQYADPAFTSGGERKEQLRSAAEAAFERLTSTALPDPRVITEALSPVVRARRFLFTTSDDAAHDLLDRVGLRPALDTGTADVVAVAHENLRANKLDAYLTRDIDYRITVGPGGQADATLTVTLTNTAPDGLDPYVTGDGRLERTADPLPETLNRTNLDVYTRLPSTEVLVDGAERPVGRSRLGDLHRSAVTIDVPAGETISVEFHLSGEIVGPYGLDLVPTATATVGRLRGTVDLGHRTQTIEADRFDHVVRVTAA